MWTVSPMIRSPPSSVSRPCRASVCCQARATRSLAPPIAAPPPMMPFMPIFAMKSRPRSDGADDRLVAFDLAVHRARHQGNLLDLVAAIRHGGRDGVVRALVGERALVERLEDDLDLLLEQRAVGVLVLHRGAEHLDLAGVVAAPDAEDHPPFGEDVGRGVVLGEADRVHIGAMLKPQP